VNKVKRFRRSVVLVVLGIIGGLGSPQADATTTAPDAVTATSDFRLEFGATVLDGTITWFNRSLHIDGSIKAVSGSKQGKFLGVNGNSTCRFDETRTTPDGTTRPFGFDEHCDMPGGFFEVFIDLNDDSGHVLGSQFCTRSGCPAGSIVSVG
jgi:hypothetical protein